MSFPPLCLNPFIVFPFLPSLSKTVTSKVLIWALPASLLISCYSCHFGLQVCPASILSQGLPHIHPSDPEPFEAYLPYG